MEKREKPPEIEIVPMEVKGWVVSMRILHHAERNPGDLSGWEKIHPSIVSGKGQGAGGQSQQKWKTHSLLERAEQGRGMEERSRDTDLGVGVGGAWLGGG